MSHHANGHVMRMHKHVWYLYVREYTYTYVNQISIGRRSIDARRGVLHIVSTTGLKGFGKQILPE